jgi:hypothetical protein
MASPANLFSTEDILPLHDRASRQIETELSEGTFAVGVGGGGGTADAVAHIAGDV